MNEKKTDIDINHWKESIENVARIWKKMQGTDSHGKSNCNFLVYKEKVIEGGSTVCFPINIDFPDKNSIESLKNLLKTIKVELYDSTVNFYGIHTDYFVKVTSDMEKFRKEEELKNEFKKYNQKEAMIIGSLCLLCITIIYILWSL